VLDLGCGIGSVLLMVADRLPDARFVGVEAQAVSFALATKNVTRNGVGDRVTLIHGDFREPLALDRFDLVTGTPPYQPSGTATPSPDEQRTYARIKMRGGVEAYLEAGSRALADDGVFVVCADARRPERVLDVAPKHGLRVVRRRDVIPRATRDALFTVWTLVLARLPAARLHLFDPGRIEVPPTVTVHPAPADSIAFFPGQSIHVVALRVASGVRMKILEAWARGIPAVATPQAAAGLEEGFAAALLRETAPAAFAAAVESLASDGYPREGLVSEGRRLLAHQHDPTAIGVRWLEIYREAAGS
jgi:SAM-dependent methyltransferase